MKRFFLLLLSCHVSSAVKHTLKYFFTTSCGVPDFSEVVGVGQVDDIPTGHCDSDRKIVEAKQSWIKDVFDDDPQHLEWYTRECFDFQPNFLKANIYHLKQRFNKSEGVHILQWMGGCQWDENTGEVLGFLQYGYNGDDFLSFDMMTQTWIAPKLQAVITKLKWDADKAEIKYNKNFLTQVCPEWLKKYVDYGKSTLLRTDLPSVSLLQKSPSSPVSCHATGFYPDRALMLWRKDGEDLHEDVDQGEILPNHDGSFQMRVDLKLSSVKPEDWGRYDCVFLLSGVKEEIITKLDKAEIRSNSEKPSNIHSTFPIIAAAVVVVLVLITVTGFIVYKKKKAEHPHSPPENGTELSDKLNPET